MGADPRKIIILRVDYDRIIIGVLIAQDSAEADRLIEELQPLIDKHEIEVDIAEESTVSNVVDYLNEEEE